MSIKLLVVDDSAFMRRIISDNIEQTKGIEVIGIARNGLDALEEIPKVKPDIITLDVEMPKLNGIETLKEIKKNYDIPVIMLSSLATPDITIEALELGAEDFIEKPRDLNANLEDFRLTLEEKIKSVAEDGAAGPARPARKPVRRKRRIKQVAKSNLPNNIKAITIAASTGGPKALVSLIGNISEDCKLPIFIVQHMPKGFTTSFANRLNKESKLKVVEAEDGMTIEAGVVYLAPGDYHMELSRNRIKLDQRDKLHGVRPAADYLFESAAKKYRRNLLAIVLTGMGKDGAGGMEIVKEYGGYNIAQDKESSLIFGMPGHAIATGAVDEIMDVETIVKNINEKVKIWR